MGKLIYGAEKPEKLENEIDFRIDCVISLPKNFVLQDEVTIHRLQVYQGYFKVSTARSIFL